MGRKLDNWSFGLSLVGPIGAASIIPLLDFILNLPSGKMPFPDKTLISIILFTPLFLVIIGFVMGIIALIKGSEEKWKPILAIIISIIGFLLNTFLILMAGGVGS